MMREERNHAGISHSEECRERFVKEMKERGSARQKKRVLDSEQRLNEEVTEYVEK